MLYLARPLPKPQIKSMPKLSTTRRAVSKHPIPGHLVPMLNHKIMLALPLLAIHYRTRP
jgi:hypothetical protein